MNNENLKTLSPNEAREQGKKGGIASGQARRERKALKDELLLLLESGDAQQRLCTALLERAFNGDTKAFEIIRDTIGERPIDKKEFNAMPPIALVQFEGTPDDHREEINAMEAEGKPVINFDIPKTLKDLKEKGSPIIIDDI